MGPRQFQNRLTTTQPTTDHVKPSHPPRWSDQSYQGHSHLAPTDRTIGLSSRRRTLPPNIWRAQVTSCAPIDLRVLQQRGVRVRGEESKVSALPCLFFGGRLIRVLDLEFRISLCRIGRGGAMTWTSVHWMAWVGVRWKEKARWRMECYLTLAEVLGVTLAGGSAITRSPDRHLLEVVDSQSDLEWRR